MKKTFPLLCLIALTSSASSTWAVPWDELYEQAVFTSPMVAQIHADSLAWRVKESRQLTELFTFVSENPSNSESLKDDVRADLEADQLYFAALSEQMKPIPCSKMKCDTLEYLLENNTSKGDANEKVQAIYV